MAKPLIHTEAICSYYTECYCGCILCDVACRGLMPHQDEIDQEVLSCIRDGKHLTSCDEDGFCNYCGNQASDADF